MVAAAAIAPSALVKKKEWSLVEENFENPNGIAVGSIDYRAQAKEELGEWRHHKWSEAIYKEFTRKCYFPLFTGDVGKYNNVIVRLK